LKRDRFLHIISISVSLEPDVQRIPKPLNGCIAFRMGWWAEVESLPVERDGVVYIAPISRFVEAGVQSGRFMPEQLKL